MILRKSKRIGWLRLRTASKNTNWRLIFSTRTMVQKLIQVSRIPIVILGCLLCFFFYRFARELYGPRVAILVLGMVVLDPNLIGHGRVVSADLGLACFFLMSHFYLYKCLINPTNYHDVIGLVASLAFCVGVKLSGLLILPSIFLISLYAIFAPPQTLLDRVGLDRQTYRAMTLRKGTVAAIAAILATYGVLAILYQDVTAPLLYFRATQLIYSNMPEGYTSYLAGQFQPNFIHYYFAALFLKSPLSVTVLFCASLASWRRQSVFDRNLIAIPIVIIMLVTVFDGVNIGLRRVLFVLPFVYLFGGATFCLALGKSNSANDWTIRAYQLVSIFSLIWSIAIATYIYPNHLSFFNLAVGGSVERPFVPCRVKC